MSYQKQTPEQIKATNQFFSFRRGWITRKMTLAKASDRFGYEQQIIRAMSTPKKLKPASGIGAVEASERLQGFRHGIHCEKAEHKKEGGYLHSDSDDGPYDVDGLTYCGRCHTWIP